MQKVVNEARAALDKLTFKGKNIKATAELGIETVSFRLKLEQTLVDFDELVAFSTWINSLNEPAKS